jgi:signal transduction histidine kinase/DNA-binding response OmpR family regulator
MSGARRACTPNVMTTSAKAPAVLLVDDRSENLLALEGVLQPLAAETGLRLLRARNADEALRHLLNEGDSVALVLLDVIMPGTGGIEIASLIRQRTRSGHVPIIFITALETDRRRVTLGYQYGAVDYLTKPIQPDVLIAKVRAFLDLHQRRGDAVLEERRRYADQVHLMREQTLRDEAALVETLQRVGTALASELDLERVVQLVTDEAISLTRAQFGVFGPAFHSDAVIRSSDITCDPRHPNVEPYPEMPRGEQPVRSYLAVPVSSRSGEVIGGLFFGHESPGVFGDREERLVVGIAGWAAVAMDNARLYAAERQAREGAEGATRAKEEFLATMSHEFRTPLNAIVGYAQLLDMGVLGPATAAQHAHLQRLQASARHLLQLVDDVLDVAKVDADRLDVRRDLLMTGAAVAAAVTLVQPQATAKGVRLVDLNTSEPGFAYVGDEHRVRQVVINLLSNAVKFTPSGGQVSVECGHARGGGPDAASEPPDASTDEQPWVFIRVEDTGPGIAPTLIAHLFEPFVQGDGALTREQGGTGLGLAISRRLARLMGGDITVETDHGSRTVFTLWLPGAAGSEATTGPQDAAAAEDTKAPRGTTVLSGISTAPLDSAAYDVLQALSVRLAADAETIAERYVAALRSDREFPGVMHLATVQLRDHVTPFVGLLASQLMIIGETRGQAPDLLRDGGQIQRAMAELHGAQRFRLGWSEAHIERETSLLVNEIIEALEHAGNPGDAIRTTSAAAGATSTIPEESVRVATDYASVVARHVLEQAARNAVRSYRFAKSADAP